MVCDREHRFDAWFRNADAYDQQVAQGILTCPLCDSRVVHKALMAPAVARAGSEKLSLSIGHPQHAELREMMRAMRKKVTSEADYVGDKFAEEARKIHFKETSTRGIYGEATRDEVVSLIEEGVDVMPLPSLPEEQN
ncbi:MAG: hypothetical protein JWR75_2155 [Devosia sp.]|nr:hypothetical protein [Devosia sp.]